MKLLIGGSPCTHWSIAQTKNRETEASGIGWDLFLNYRIARDKYQPDYFLYENNKSMSPAIRAQITAELGVEPVLINSALVSAQNSQRLYWVGRRNPDGTYSQVDVEQPADRGILLRDILETGVCWHEKGYTLKTPANVKPLTEKEMEYMVRGTKDGRNHFDFDYFHDATRDKSACVTANTHKGVPYNVLADPVQVDAIKSEESIFCINALQSGKSRTVDAHMAKLEGCLEPRNDPNPAKQQYDCIVEPVRIGTIENDAQNQDFDSQQYRVYSPDGKSVTLCGNGGGLGAKTGLYAVPVEEPVNTTADGKAQCLRATYYKDGIRNMVGNNVDRKTCVAVRVGDMPNAEGVIRGGQAHRVYDSGGKAVTLTARPNGGGGVDGPLYAVPAPVDYAVGRECEVKVTANSIRCQRKDKKHSTVQGSHVTLPTGKTQVSPSHVPMVIEAADGKQLPVYEVRGGQITIKGKQYPIKLADGFYIIRKLTVTECKRLQTVPDTYAFPVSATQAYKMLGNGWTVDVIAHIMSHFEGLTAEPVEVLSMYDGMSCGRIALNKLGANVTRYYATEIDKYAIQTTQHNFPDTVQLGDAFQVRNENWQIGGS